MDAVQGERDGDWNAYRRGGRPDGGRQSEKDVGEQTSLGLGGWNSSQRHVKGEDRRLLGDLNGRGMRV